MNLNKVYLIFAILFIEGGILFSQEQLYTVRGVITDALTKESLIGANISIKDKSNIGTSTDVNGEFAIQLPLGKFVIEASYLGYKNYIIPIDVRSGKELVLSIGMSEDITSMDEIVVSAQNDKARPVNAMSYASTRTFSVEESNKFAAAVDDPLRMVQSYAGVVGLEDGNNHISVRGNSPNGLLWRMEGVDIPNPNHYADPSSSGGGVSVLSSQMLGNSDFSTGAFAAEYGNALSGVFDLKLRRGNNKKREYTFKASFLGLEAAVEGPFSKNYNGSYLVNYRYSTLSIISKLGVDLQGVLNYSDLSYNIVLPTNKFGTFSLFGIHGVSSQVLDETLDSIEMPLALAHEVDGRFQSNMSVDGVKHTISPWKDAYLNTTFAYGESKNSYRTETNTVYQNSIYYDKFNSLSQSGKVTLTSNLTQKLKNGVVLRAGLTNDYLTYKVIHDVFEEGNPNALSVINANNSSDLIQSFIQAKWDMSANWTSNFGLHYSHFILNGTNALEPRVSLKRRINDKSSLALSYGLHSQLNTLAAYFVKSDDELNPLPNKDLEMSKAHHLVLTHEQHFNDYTRLRTEVYYQNLFDLAVGTDDNSDYALLNQRFELPTFLLTNNGKGKNYGIETTLERFLHNDLYFILTGSLSDSKYKTSTSGWLNTRYNTEYSAITTIGKDWQVGKNKQNQFGLNLKLTFVGGQYYTPIDLEASIVAQEEVLVNDATFSSKNPDFFKLDVGVKLVRNHKKYTSILSLDVMNATNRKNIGGYNYYVGEEKIKAWYQAPLIPILSYKVEF